MIARPVSVPWARPPANETSVAMDQGAVKATGSPEATAVSEGYLMRTSTAMPS